MPAIHVIFDPNDKVHVQPEMIHRLGVSVAVTTLSAKEVKREAIAEIAAGLAVGLLTAIAKDQG